MREVDPDDCHSIDEQKTDLAGTSVLLRPTGRRTPDSSRMSWQNLRPGDRTVYLKWLVWVSCFYLALAAGLLFLMKHSSDLNPLLAHPLTYRVRFSDALGFAASIAVLVTFLMPSMLLLRLVAIVSNVLFVTYGYLGHIYPVLLLHLALLPINLTRVVACSYRPETEDNGARGRTPSPHFDR